MIRIEKINESYSRVYGDVKTIHSIFEMLKVMREDAKYDPLVKRGFKSKYDYFSKIEKDNKSIIVMNGHIKFLKNFKGYTDIEEENIFTQDEVKNYINSIVDFLPFKPYDYQLKIVEDAFIRQKGIFKSCTGCLDGDTIYDVECDSLSEKELLDILKEIP